jgi:hypothetical protein
MLAESNGYRCAEPGGQGGRRGGCSRCSLRLPRLLPWTLADLRPGRRLAALATAAPAARTAAAPCPNHRPATAALRQAGRHRPGPEPCAGGAARQPRHARHPGALPAAAGRLGGLLGGAPGRPQRAQRGCAGGRGVGAVGGGRGAGSAPGTSCFGVACLAHADLPRVAVLRQPQPHAAGAHVHRQVHTGGRRGGALPLPLPLRLPCTELPGSRATSTAQAALVCT